MVLFLNMGEMRGTAANPVEDETPQKKGESELCRRLDT